MYIFFILVIFTTELFVCIKLHSCHFLFVCLFSDIQKENKDKLESNSLIAVHKLGQ